jgi:hypothetical protein
MKQAYRAVRRRVRGDLLPEQYAPAGWDALPSDEERAFVRARCAAVRPDVVIAEYAWLSPLLTELPSAPRPLAAVLTVDLMHRREEDFARLGIPSGHAPWTRQAETSALQAADLVLAFQDEEASVFQDMLPDAEVMSVPMAATVQGSSAEQIPGRCLFVGSPATHNVTGLTWYLETVWPHVLATIPNATLHVAGPFDPALAQKYPNVRVLGQVDDATQEYGEAQVCIVPLLVGSGLKIKVIQAVSYGRACVSTSVGLQGLAGLRNKGALLADSSEDFAAAVLQVLTDPAKRRQLEVAALHFASTRLSPQATYQPVVDRFLVHARQASPELATPAP